MTEENNILPICSHTKARSVLVRTAVAANTPCLIPHKRGEQQHPRMVPEQAGVAASTRCHRGATTSQPAAPAALDPTRTETAQAGALAVSALQRARK